MPEEEARLVLTQIVNGFRAIHSSQVLHRDLKLENILLHFPGNKDLLNKDKETRKKFLEKVDLRDTEFLVKIADLGLAK